MPKLGGGPAIGCGIPGGGRGTPVPPIGGGGTPAGPEGTGVGAAGVEEAGAGTAKTMFTDGAAAGQPFPSRPPQAEAVPDAKRAPVTVNALPVQKGGVGE
jgi:hypothetical protein